MCSSTVTQFIRVGSTDEVPPGVTRRVDFDGREVLLANVDGNYYAVGNVCTHEEGPLDQGILDGYEVQCPWHESRFDLRSGEPTQGPAMAPVPTYEVKVEGTDILIRAK